MTSLSRIMRFAFAGALLAASGLGSGCADCGAPAKAQYSKSPVSAGTAGCAGYSPDQDKIYPVDTVVKLPKCLEAYPNEIATCTCSERYSGGQEPQWYCPI